MFTSLIYSVIQVCRYNCPDPVCPEDTATAPAVNVQASITAQPAYGGDSLSNSIPSKLNQLITLVYQVNVPGRLFFFEKISSQDA